MEINENQNKIDNENLKNEIIIFHFFLYYLKKRRKKRQRRGNEKN